MHWCPVIVNEQFNAIKLKLIKTKLRALQSDKKLDLTFCCRLIFLLCNHCQLHKYICHPNLHQSVKVCELNSKNFSGLYSGPHGRRGDPLMHLIRAAVQASSSPRPGLGSTTPVTLPVCKY